jgi:hypothetical protein
MRKNRLDFPRFRDPSETQILDCVRPFMDGSRCGSADADRQRAFTFEDQNGESSLPKPEGDAGSEVAASPDHDGTEGKQHDTSSRKALNQVTGTVCDAPVRL